MAKKGNDINLFKAASKADKKIQTGVSKGFIFVIAGFLAIIAIGAYVGNLLVSLQTVKSDLLVYAGYESYSTGVNILYNQVENDKALLGAIQTDIEAANAIKYYAKSTTILYPGLTRAQKNLILNKSYTEQGSARIGCVPDGVDLDRGIELSMTDGIKSYTVIKTNDEYEDVTEDIIFDKGYVVIKFESENDTIGIDYINNILLRAGSVFAKEKGQNALSAESFEMGYFSKPQGNNTYYSMYVKCKLKSVIQIIMEDVFIDSYLVNEIEDISFTGTAISIKLKTHTVQLYKIANYLNSTELFLTIGYTGETKEYIGENYQYSGVLLCSLKEVN